MEHCFDDLSLHRFVLEAAVDNIPSCEIADRIGMRLEGINERQRVAIRSLCRCQIICNHKAGMG